MDTLHTVYIIYLILNCSESFDTLGLTHAHICFWSSVSFISVVVCCRKMTSLFSVALWMNYLLKYKNKCMLFLLNECPGVIYLFPLNLALKVLLSLFLFSSRQLGLNPLSGLKPNFVQIIYVLGRCINMWESINLWLKPLIGTIVRVSGDLRSGFFAGLLNSAADITIWPCHPSLLLFTEPTEDCLCFVLRPSGCSSAQPWLIQAGLRGEQPGRVTPPGIWCLAAVKPAELCLDWGWNW